MNAGATTGPASTALQVQAARAVAPAGLAVLAALVVLRLRAMHAGLLYPDGYQYLLMARGIGEHLQPIATLGHGGDTLAPSADAAAKPLFPALVALGAEAGLSPLEAARLLTAAAGAAVAPLAGLLALRLGASRAPAALAAVLCLASPTLGFWLGFPGPDALGLALALGASLAFVCRRPVAGGVLAGLAVTTRPELIAIAVGAALAAVVSPRLRREATIGSAAGLAVAGGVVGVVRPPLATSTLLLLPVAAALGVLAAAAVVAVALASARASLAAAVGLVVLLAYALARGGAWTTVAARDWPLLALAGLGLLGLVRSPAARPTGLRVAAFVAALALAYWWKNPGSERYVAMLLPALAVLASLGLARLRPFVLAGAAALALAGLALASEPSVGPDSFTIVAASLERAPAGPIVTAAPDAYSAVLPGRAIRVMRPGESGLVLVDGAARAYEPDLRVDGTLIATYSAGDGFLRPDGRLDTAPVLLYRGTVVTRR